MGVCQITPGSKPGVSTSIVEKQHMEPVDMKKQFDSKYTKLYYEIYALECINLFFDTGISIKDKHESPDWLKKDNTLGIEVTRAISKNDGEKLAYINHYFGKGLPAEYIINNIDNEKIKLSKDMRIVDDTLFYIKNTDSSSAMNQIANSIEKKSKLLQTKRIEELWLFVFSNDMPLYDEDFYGLMESDVYRESIFKKIIIYNADKAFVLDGDGVCSKTLGDDELSRIKKDALSLSKNQ